MVWSLDLSQGARVTIEVIIELQIGQLVHTDKKKAQFFIGIFALKIGYKFPYGTDLILLDRWSLSIADTFSEENKSDWVAAIFIMEILHGFSKTLVYEITNAVLILIELRQTPVLGEIWIRSGGHAENLFGLLDNTS